MPEQMPLLGTVNPPGETPKTPPKWEPPPLPPDTMGGYLTARSTGIPTSLSSNHISSLAALLWSPRRGKFRDHFEATLDGPQYIYDLIFPAHFAHEMQLGDWVVVNKVKELNNISVVEHATVIKPDQHYGTYKLDMHWIGPQRDILGEGHISIGLDEDGKTVVLQHNKLKKYFGRIPSKTQEVTLLPYDGSNALDTSFYDLLGITPPVTDSEVKAAYREKAKVTHPDVNPDPGAVAAFQQLNEAYELLKEEPARDLYDMCLLMASANYGSSSDTGEILTGLHGNGWYPLVTSGTIQAAGYQTGSVIILTEITDIAPVKNGTQTRVAIETEGMVDLYWTEDL